MSLRTLSERTPVTISVAVAALVAVAAGAFTVGGLSERVDQVEKQQEKTDDWAAKTAEVLAELKVLTKEHDRRLAAREMFP